jgi:hypothetical protein
MSWSHLDSHSPETSDLPTPILSQIAFDSLLLQPFIFFLKCSDSIYSALRFDQISKKTNLFFNLLTIYTPQLVPVPDFYRHILPSVDIEDRNSRATIY